MMSFAVRGQRISACDHCDAAWHYASRIGCRHLAELAEDADGRVHWLCRFSKGETDIFATRLSTFDAWTDADGIYYPCDGELYTADPTWRPVPAPAHTAEEARSALRCLGANGPARRSQRKLAAFLVEALGRPVSQPTVNAWIAGKTPVPMAVRDRIVHLAYVRSRPVVRVDDRLVPV
jgi:hypothetical protein